MSRTASSSIDYDLLASVLGLLGSNHDGEVLAAARAASEMMCRSGRDWRSILPRETLSPSGETAPGQFVEHPSNPFTERLSPPVGASWIATLEWMCSHDVGATQPEKAFLTRHAQRLGRMSARGQPTCLDYNDAEIVVRLYRRHAVAAHAP